MVDARAPGPLGIVGFGHFGRALASLAAGAGLEYLAYDPAPGAPIDAHRAVRSPAELAGRARTLVLCIPTSELEPCLRGLRPSLSDAHLVLDVGSVKVGPARVMAEALGADISWCATHPLFGPAALSRGERPLRAVVCPNAMHPTAHRRAAELFGALGCQTLEQSPDEHDRLMARTHAMAFFVARAMLELGAPDGGGFVPPSFRAMAQTIDTVRVDAGHLFSLIQLENPYAAESRRALIDALVRIDAELGATR